MIINLDVTLRDGGYRNNFDFPLDYVLHHVRQSTQSGMQWVEIGYRNGSFSPRPGMGRTGMGSNEYIKAVSSVVSPDRLCMILHPKNVAEHDLSEMYEAGIRLLRFCLPSHSPGRGLELLSKASEIGFTTTVNVTRVSQLNRLRLVELATMSNDSGADVLYLADSNGSLLPQHVTRLVTLVRSVSDMQIGFHAHNNLGLALANAIAAVEAGAT